MLSIHILQIQSGYILIQLTCIQKHRLTGYLSINGIEILPTCRCLRCLKVDWRDDMFTDDIEHGINCLQGDRLKMDRKQHGALSSEITTSDTNIILGSGPCYGSEANKTD